MPPTLAELGVDKLSIEDRLSIAHALFDHVHDEMEADTELSPELKAELDRRLALADADPNRGTPWEEVRARVRARYYP